MFDDLIPVAPSPLDILAQYKPYDTHELPKGMGNDYIYPYDLLVYQRWAEIITRECTRCR